MGMEVSTGLEVTRQGAITGEKKEGEEKHEVPQTIITYCLTGTGQGKHPCL